MKDGFYFTVDGMYCAYNYRLRNELNTDCSMKALFFQRGKENRKPQHLF